MDNIPSTFASSFSSNPGRYNSNPINAIANKQNELSGILNNPNSTVDAKRDAQAALAALNQAQAVLHQANQNVISNMSGFSYYK